MSVKVTLTVEIGSGPHRSTHVVDVRIPGDNERFAADSTVVATLRALAAVLTRMPAEQHQMKDVVHNGKRHWPPAGTERRAAA